MAAGTCTSPSSFSFSCGFASKGRASTLLAVPSNLRNYGFHHPRQHQSCSGKICLARASTATKPEKSPAEEDWKVKRQYLVKNQVRSVTAKEAYRLQKEDGYVILDVRPEGEFKQAHPEGAINAQVYRLIKEWTAWDVARRAAFAFFGIFAGTEENPGFVTEVQSKIDKDARVIVACAAGGTMKPSDSLVDGQQSRSLIAAYLMKLNGYKSIVHMEGGLKTWFKEGLPTTYGE